MTPSPYAQLIWRYAPPLLWPLALIGAHELAPLVAEGLSVAAGDPAAHLAARAAALVVALGALWATDAQNAPADRLRLAPSSGAALGAAALLALGGVALGSELDNVLSGALAGEAPPPAPLSAEDLAAREEWRRALLTPLGLSFTLALLPLAEAWVFHGLFQRNLSGLREGGRLALVSLALTLCSWRLSPSSLVANLCAAWLFERARSPLAAAVGLAAWQGVGLLVAVGAGPGVEGFDNLSAPWQPLWFDLLGCALLMGGWGLAERAAVALGDGDDERDGDEDGEYMPGDDDEGGA